MEEILKEILAELKAVRELLETRNSQGMCPHGTIGFCMFCIQPTLDGIETAVREGVRRRG